MANFHADLNIILLMCLRSLLSRKLQWFCQATATSLQIAALKSPIEWSVSSEPICGTRLPVILHDRGEKGVVRQRRQTITPSSLRVSRFLQTELTSGLLDLFEATGDDTHAMWAIELQKCQDEMFWDHQSGGYFASAPDEHVLVRMKEAHVRFNAIVLSGTYVKQDSAEPSAMSVSVHNLSRLSLLATNDFDKYEKRAEDTYLSLSAELTQAPRAFAYTVSGVMDLEKGYREVSRPCQSS